MNTHAPFSADASDEVSALIATLHATGQRLEELTSGEVDTVSDHEGRTFALRRTQDHMRHRDAARQAAILNALPAHIALLNAQGLIVSVNETWRRFIDPNVSQGPGYAIGTNYLDMCASARGADAVTAHRVADGIRSVLDGGAMSFSIEYACHTPLQQRWFLLTVTPLAAGLPNGVVVMHVDITAEKKAEENLRTSESRFRQMADNIIDVFFLVDAVGGRMLYISPAYAEIWGLSCESAYARPESWTDAIHPDDRVATLEKYREGLAGAKSRFEYRIVRPDGSIRWIETRGFPIHDQSGNIARIAGIAKDITEQKRAAQALRESERRFSDMLDNVDLVTVMLDCEARITYCNDYLLRLTGWSLEEVIGKDWFESFMPVEVGDMKPVFAELLANAPAAWHVENELLTRSGERRLIRWNNSVLRSGAGDVIGTASIGEDI
ncbi:MAG TPA: PAS domain S-box protein, partial [Xanthomonadaceae bacterium]|nr:PAS domain S-box protein [Xanthomonadaceae bacterium]